MSVAMIQSRRLRPSPINSDNHAIRRHRLAIVAHDLDQRPYNAMHPEPSFATTHAATTRADVHNLPAEILLSVFLHIVADDSALATRHVTPAIVVASQVCSRWRSVALDHSQCWGSIDICARRWARTFIERSGNLSLTLTAREHVSTEQLSIFEPHFARVRELVLSSSAGEGKRLSTETASSLLSPTAMHALESLHLEDQPHYDYHAAAPPTLRRVILRDGCYISPLFSILTSNLVHLELSQCYSAEGTGFDAVHSILLALPDLQTLVLNYAQKSYFAPASTPPVEPATLSRLRQLHVRDTLSNLVRRLQLLQVPRETQITVASEEPVSIATLSAVAALAVTMSTHTSAASHNLVIDAPAPGTCTGRIALSYQTSQGGHELARMELATGAGHAPVPCILRKFLGPGHLHVHKMHASHGHFFAPCAWTDLHYLAPEVKQVTISGQANIANGLLRALQTKAYSGLEELTIADVVLGGRGGVDMSAWARVRAARPTLDVRMEKCTVRANPLTLASSRDAFVYC
ncbi:hypothetical protein PENSPDRAFT_740181 [Peniophora sp. CONT]|nr:hypothetical protein PENSPDRAFT_740181 [Peniophora sp. CONT]